MPGWSGWGSGQGKPHMHMHNKQEFQYEVEEASFDELVVARSHEAPVLVDIG